MKSLVIFTKWLSDLCVTSYYVIHFSLLINCISLAACTVFVFFPGIISNDIYYVYRCVREVVAVYPVTLLIAFGGAFLLEDIVKKR